MAMDGHVPPPRPFHSFTLGKSTFEVDIRYMNLRPVGRGAYGLVAAADDLLTGRKARMKCREGYLHAHFLSIIHTLPNRWCSQVAIKRISRVFQDLIDAKRILREIKLLR